MDHPQLFRTYAAKMPAATHYRSATCQEIECAAFAHGWATRVPIGSSHVDWIRAGKTGRRFTEHTAEGGAEVEFTFPPGQPCFRASEHRVPIDRPALYVVRDGMSQRQHANGVDWRDDMGEHLDKVRIQRERG